MNILDMRTVILLSVITYIICRAIPGESTISTPWERFFISPPTRENEKRRVRNDAGLQQFRFYAQIDGSEELEGGAR